MNNEHNYGWETPDREPWNQDTYRTGSTKPPKSHGGLIAALLVLVILLCGIITILGIVNIRLFRQINYAESANTLPITFSNDNDVNIDSPLPHTPAEPEAPQETKAPECVDIAISVPGIENTPQEGGYSLQEIYSTVIDSVVSISSLYPGGSSTGTGVILTDTGYIVTNCHVVENAKQLQVLLTDGRTIDAVLVGMDEVSDLAFGNYYKKNGGSESRFDIFNKHLERVVEICKKYDFEPMIWSDMYFSLSGNHRYDFDELVEVPKEAVDKMSDAGLVFWDYYHDYESFYDVNIKKHMSFGKTAWFAGGVWDFDGFAPNYAYTLKTMNPALSALP